MNVSELQGAVEVIAQGVNRGLPKLEFEGKPTSFFEFWPVWLVYIPVVVYWLLLSVRYRSFGLPMAVNPRIELGGMVGESKHAILDPAGAELRQHILPYIKLDVQRKSDLSCAVAVMRRARGQGIDFPCVIKPDKGCRGSGVQLLNGLDELQHYLDCHRDKVLLVQQLAPYTAEAGVFYVREPDVNQGRIVSLAFKYCPTVVGDGKNTLKQLILSHPRAQKMAELHCKKNHAALQCVPAVGEEVALEFVGSHCRGSIFRNGNQFITAEMEARFDALLQQLPGFHYGRLDVKFRDVDALQRGKAFYILEINGASSEQAHIWDSRTSFGDAILTLLRQYKWLFVMGDKMRARGVSVPSVKALLRVWWKHLHNA